MYANGFCPTAEDGTLLPCPDGEVPFLVNLEILPSYSYLLMTGYGALLGTAAVCALLEVLIAFAPPKIILKIFPRTSPSRLFSCKSKL